MSKLSECKKTNCGKTVDEQSNCRYFERIAQSLIEEPEVCEWCEYFEDGLCYRPQEG